MAFSPSIRRNVRCAQRAQQRTRALTPEPNVALLLEWVSCLPTALGCPLVRSGEFGMSPFFWAALTLAKFLIYAPSITVTEQNCSQTAVANRRSGPRS
jgi:hypothetical protein